MLLREHRRAHQPSSIDAENQRNQQDSFREAKRSAGLFVFNDLTLFVSRESQTPNCPADETRDLGLPCNSEKQYETPAGSSRKCSIVRRAPRPRPGAPMRGGVRLWRSATQNGAENH